jgi:nucleolar protein 15
MPIADRKKSPRNVPNPRGGRSKTASRQADPRPMREKKKTQKEDQKTHKETKKESKKAAPKVPLGDVSSDDYDDSGDDAFDVANAEKLAQAAQAMKQSKDTTQRRLKAMKLQAQKKKQKQQKEREESDSSFDSQDVSDSEDDSGDIDVGAASALARGAASGDVVALSTGNLLKPQVPGLPGDVQERVRALREARKAAHKEKKGKAKVGVDSDGRSRVVFLGRIPYGFFEVQMRAFFEQFGEVKRLRLSRNKKTGRSKHFAFIEMEDADTAQVVAESMDDYLLFRHRLQCRVVQPDDIHPEMWKGANQRYNKAPWRKINRVRHNKPRDLQRAKTITKRALSREERKRARLAQLGIDFDFPGTPTMSETMTSSEEKKSTKSPSGASPRRKRRAAESPGKERTSTKQRKA